MARPPGGMDDQQPPDGGAGRYSTALFELGDRLLNIQDPAEMGYVAAEIAGRTLGACRAGYGTVDAARGKVDVARDWVMPGFKSLAGTRRYIDDGAYRDRLARGEPIIYCNVAAEAAPDSAAGWIGVDAHAVVNLPVFEHANLVAVVYVHNAQPRAWRADEIAFLYNLAERTRSAVERRRAEQDLRALTRRLEREVAERTADRNRLWQLSADVMLVAQFGGTIVATNPAWAATFGWTEAELAGRPFAELTHPDDQAATSALLQGLDDGHAARAVPIRCRHRNGTYRWIAWNAVPGEGLINAVGRDITDDREKSAALAQAEEQLRQAQKMEAVGQLTGGLAHDFNNLLQAISGSLELAGRRLEQGRTGDAARFLTSAQDVVGRAASLTHRLLAFARRQALDPTLVDPGALAMGMAELVQRTVGSKITVTLDAPAQQATVLCDANQLENALLNLAINARDAMPGGGTLRIAVRTVLVADGANPDGEPAAPGRYVELAVTDTGTGMDAATSARAFEPFFTTKPIGAGSGLGLSQTYGFVRQSGGFVRMDSAPGCGTAVRLFLPYHPHSGGTTAPASTLPPAAAGGQVALLVEDQPGIRTLLAEHLRDAGFIVHEAADAASGLAQLESGTVRPDILITDIGMPGGMDGRQLADRATVLRPSLPVLLVTGYAGAALDRRLPAGVEVLTKPFKFDDLTARVQAILAAAGEQAGLRRAGQ